MRARLFLILLAAAAAWAQPADGDEFFETKIRPLLAEKCLACHGTVRQGGLEMSSRQALLKGGNSGPAIVPGQPEKSLLIAAVRQTHERLKMPLGGKLADGEVADLVAWVSSGAAWPEKAGGAEHRAFWSLEPVRKPAPPKVRRAGWAKSPIDRFILAKLEEKGLDPAPPADQRALLRRVYYDLIGLPPAPEQVEAFRKDSAPDAFAKVVDGLLASPRYGERWGRHWLDVARYSDDKLNSTQDEPYANAFRYRDWVIQAFNDDLPYDRFVKAQIAGDLLDGDAAKKLTAGLGFYALRPEFQDDRVDATTRGFLGLTVACAQCHDHKYDPIPTKDYYSLLGVFTSTENYEAPLAPEHEVRAYKEHKKKIEAQETAIKEFVDRQSRELGEILAARTADYLTAADSGALDPETLERWKRYLKSPTREHPYLDEFLAERAQGGDGRQQAAAFQELVLAVVREKRQIDEKNLIRLGGSNERRALSSANLLSLERDKYFLWRDLFADRRGASIYFYGEKTIDRFLHGEWKAHLESVRAQLEALKKGLPPAYPFLHTIKDAAKPANQRVHIRGNRDNLGEEAPRRFLAALSRGEPVPFARGSGRLDLAEAIASPDNPLTARVMVNRIWQHHFGAGLVRTASNFGALGERPTHPELLDYLAARFVENNWSIKSMHREILLSAVYALSAENSAKHSAIDPDNRLLWRSSRRRLDAEALRDSLLYVAGTLDLTPGGLPVRGDANRRRAVYGFISRRRIDPMLALFDFPNPNSTAEQRIETNVPLQRLFFLNSEMMLEQAEALACRASEAGADDASRMRRMCRLVLGRAPSAEEMKLGREFARSDGWARYAQVLLSSNEFLFVN